jgi:hypothetical protein
MGHEGHPKAIDYYWAHLAGIRVVAEIPSAGVSIFWTAGSASQQQVFTLLSQTGARALITGTPPPISQRGGLASAWRHWLLRDASRPGRFVRDRFGREQQADSAWKNRYSGGDG